MIIRRWGLWRARRRCRLPRRRRWRYRLPLILGKRCAARSAALRCYVFIDAILEFKALLQLDLLDAPAARSGSGGVGKGVVALHRSREIDIDLPAGPLSGLRVVKPCGQAARCRAHRAGSPARHPRAPREVVAERAARTAGCPPDGELDRGTRTRGSARRRRRHFSSRFAGRAQPRRALLLLGPIVRGRQPQGHTQFFWASIINSARSSLRRSRALSRVSCSIWRAEASGFGPRRFGARATRSAAAPSCLRQLDSIEE